MSLVVLVPVLGRPHRVAPTLDGFSPHRVVFIPDPTDADERAAIEAAGAEQMPVDGNYAQKINAAVRKTDEPLVFIGADDLEPQQGWFENAVQLLGSGIQTVGVNDLIDRPRRPEHATHFLVTREYALQPTADGGIGPLHEGYGHWGTDDEFIGTAKSRGVYAYARDSHVEHLHPINGKAPDDPTYQKGTSLWRRQDWRILQSRRALWT